MILSQLEKERWPLPEMFNKKICFKIYRLGNELNNGGLLRLNSFYTMYIVQYKLKSDFRLSPTPFCSEL